MDYFDEVTDPEQNNVLCGATHGGISANAFLVLFHISDCNNSLPCKYKYYELLFIYKCVLFLYRERRKRTLLLRRSL